jgi:nucleotide-binding universal stress UspA family protein
MFRTVLVPLDGSWFAESALPVAARLAKAAGAKLHLVLVHVPAPALVGMGDVVLPTPELEAEMQSEERAYIADTAAGISLGGGVAVEVRESDGRAGPEICEEATRIGADLVVMATHGRGGFRRLWLGSVADYVVRHMSVPVLLVHPDRKGVLGAPPQLRRILVALDLSKDGEAILKPAIALARVTGAALTLVHVTELVFETAIPAMPSPVLPDQALLEASQTAARERLDRIATRLRALGLKADVRVTLGIGAASGLVDLLEEDEFDLIAMTTHGRGGMSRVLLGSVADKVIRSAAKPVLVLRPSALVR